MNKYILILVFISYTALLVQGQSADQYGVNGANQYIDGNTSLALQTIDEGISKYPNDDYLPWLKERILEDQENQDQQNEQNQDQENQDQEKQDQQKSDEQKESEQQNADEQKDGEEKEGEQKDQEQDQEGEQSEEEKQREMDEATKQKLQEMNISEEKARMILEALRNNEIQYIQQQKRQSTEPQDSGKPDW
ncbi:MAG: hypothetical protein ABJN36_17695 [Cyclobacteriaceae bacterium]